jgi:hypothetical protein
VGEVVAHTELLPNDLSDPWGRPAVCGVAEYSGSPREDAFEDLPLLIVQLGGPTRDWLREEAGKTFAVVGGPPTPH